MKKATFPAEILQLKALMEWIHECLKDVRIESSILGRIELASEEAFVNIIHHSYRGKEGKVDVTIRLFGDGIEIAFQDKGPPFDPLAHLPTFDPLAALDDRKIGGLGLLFMHQYMDSIHYHHDGTYNCLVLTKKFRC